MMKKSAVLLFMLCVVSLSAAPLFSLYDLRCEHEENPVGIESATPAPETHITCVPVDPLIKIFRGQGTFPETDDSAHVAKGETASFQLIVRSKYPISNLQVTAGDLISGSQRVSSSLKAFTGYHPIGKYAPDPSKDVLKPASGLFPDYLQEFEYIEVPAATNQPVWINYDIPHNAVPATYHAEVSISGKVQNKNFSITRQLSTKVYPVTVPEQTLWLSNRMWVGDYQLRQMNNGMSVEPFSDHYWSLFKVLANKARDAGQNTYFFYSPLDYVQCSVSGNTYSFDFSRFDLLVDFLIKEGNLKRLEVGAFGERSGSTILIKFPLEGGTWEQQPLSDARVQNFLSLFAPALYNHIKSKGWEGMYLQHLADEPGKGGQTTAYKQLAQFVKSRVPQLKIIEAIDPWGDIQAMNMLDVYVAQPGVCHTDYSFLQSHQAAGNEVRMYTCMYPQGNYANRFFELPLIQTRLLHWINYKYKITGYLHWAFNFRPSGYPNWKNHAAFTLGGGGGLLPAGDAWLVYPAYGTVYSTVRYEAMRDGVKDYELLKLLEKKNPARAQEIVNSTIFDFDNYNSDESAFLATGIKMLKWQSE
ncbi:MAG: DUF4091 domain-containing protein [Tannerella sp.]|jgi:hypothetical protein|nr:DUF4091 domain-containing protein [Tannerella sp.]